MNYNKPVYTECIIITYSKPGIIKLGSYSELGFSSISLEDWPMSSIYYRYKVSLHNYALSDLKIMLL